MIPSAELTGFGYDSVFPSAILLGLVFLLAATPLFRAADSPPDVVPHRVLSLDGLRGFLALAVVLHHLSVYHGFLATGHWSLPPNHFYAALGPFGVSLFFMITSYLFWGRLLRSQGRMDWRALYVGRIFRIGPLFMMASAIVLMAAGVHTGFHRHVSVLLLLRQVVRWLSLGLLNGMDVNGWNDAPLILAGVTWSVQWEWFFYLSLPLLALLARKPRLQLPLLMIALLCSIAVLRLDHDNVVVNGPLSLLNLFLAGMVVTCLRRDKRLPTIPDWAGSTVILLCCAFALSVRVYSNFDLIALSIAFYLVISGCTLFGLLLTRPARRLGDISYGIYLLQGLALFVIFQPAPLKQFALSAPWHHWVLGLVACVLLLGFATLAHVWIERPGIALGKRLLRRRTKLRNLPGDPEPATLRQ